MSFIVRVTITELNSTENIPASEMTYIVSGGALNSTHSLTENIRSIGSITAGWSQKRIENSYC